MRILSIVSCVLLTTLILGCDSVAPNAPDYASATESTDSFAAKKTVKMVPLKGSFTSVFQFPPPSDIPVLVDCGGPPLVTIAARDEINLTHLGNSTSFTTHCGDVSGLPDPNIPLINGIGILQAANGDEVHFEYEGDLVASFVCGVPVVFETNATITGGTGRFENASGAFKTTGSQLPFRILTTGEFCPPSDPPPGFLEVSIDGQISSVGSS